MAEPVRTPARARLRLVHGRVYAINEIPGNDDDAPDVDLSLDAVAVCLLTTAPPGRAQCPPRRGGNGHLVGGAATRICHRSVCCAEHRDRHCRV